MPVKLKKALLILAGTISLILGTLGIVLPLLPTTPFLLLSAYCYTKSSKKLYLWLIHHKIFGIYIYSYITYRAIDLKTKIGAISLLWITLTISIFVMQILYVTIILFIVGIGVTTHLLMLKTLTKKAMTEKRVQGSLIQRLDAT